MNDPEKNLDERIQQLISIIKCSGGIHLETVQNAIAFGRKMHEKQFRKSGELYFTHPIQVAMLATEYNLDTETVVASLLHDVVEDTPATVKDVESLFGATVGKMVDALTKVKTSKKLTLYKLFNLGHIDFRAILIKLLDRLNNLSDLENLPRAKQRSICLETSTIYCEVANGLGLIEIEEKLRDLVFQHSYPRSYQEISNDLDLFYNERHMAIQRIIIKIVDCISPDLLQSISPLYFSTGDFMFKRDKILRILESITIETYNPEDCYRIMGQIHTQMRSIPLSIRDYISNPKANGWRGISTRVIVNGEPVSISIVTKEFQEKNRRGLITLVNEGIYQSDDYVKIMELFLDVAHDAVRIEDVFRHSKAKTIQTLTPKGELVELRYGATILDFAFSIHSDLGLKCTGGIIDNVRYLPNKILEDGMIVKVLSGDKKLAKKEWIKDVVMPKARKEILKYTSTD